MQTIKYQSLQTLLKPPNEEPDEIKIQVLKEEYMDVDVKKKEGFNFCSVVFKADHVKEELIKQEMSWPPSLLTLATGANSFTFLVFYVFISNR